MRARISFSALAMLAAMAAAPANAEEDNLKAVGTNCALLGTAGPVEKFPTRVTLTLQYPRSESEELGEGWVDATFTVAPNGTLTNIETIDVLGSVAYSKTLLESLQAARFEPAIKGGRPIDYYGNEFSASFAFGGRNRAGIHFYGFSRAYDDARYKRDHGDNDASVAIIREAMKQPLNMYELSTLSHVLTYTYLAMKDDHRALIAIRHAAVMGGRYLAKEAAPHALAMLAKLEGRNNNPHGALCAHHQLQSDFAAFPVDDELKQLAAKAQSQLSGSDPVRTDIELVDWGRPDVPNRWIHRLLRRSFSFENVGPGNAKVRELCGTSVREEPIVAGKEWRPDPGQGACTLLFYGDNGVKFTLVEK